MSMADRHREFKAPLVALWTQCAFHRKRDNNVPANRMGPGFAHLRLGNNAWFRRGDFFQRIGSRDIMRQLPPQAVAELDDVQKSLPHGMRKSRCALRLSLGLAAFAARAYCFRSSAAHPCSSGAGWAAAAQSAARRWPKCAQATANP